LYDLHVLVSALRDERPGLRHAGRMEVHAGDPARRADPVCQQIQDSLRAAAKIDHAAALGDPYPVQQHLAVIAQLIGLAPQPVPLGGAVPQRIRRASVGHF
jgi:hypothetical protein